MKPSQRLLGLLGFGQECARGWIQIPQDAVLVGQGHRVGQAVDRGRQRRLPFVFDVEGLGHALALGVPQRSFTVQPRLLDQHAGVARQPPQPEDVGVGYLPWPGKTHRQGTQALARRRFHRYGARRDAAGMIGGGVGQPVGRDNRRRGSLA